MLTEFTADFYLSGYTDINAQQHMINIGFIFPLKPPLLSI